MKLSPLLKIEKLDKVSFLGNKIPMPFELEQQRDEYQKNIAKSNSESPIEQKSEILHVPVSVNQE